MFILCIIFQIQGETGQELQTLPTPCVLVTPKESDLDIWHSGSPWVLDTSRSRS